MQNVLKANHEEVWSLIEEGAVVYLCGDASRMAPAVEKAFIELYRDETGAERAGRRGVDAGAQGLPAVRGRRLATKLTLCPTWSITGPGAIDASGYLPIAEHGLIGDLHTVALVGTDGTIDWYCCPRFDAPSLFGAILDKERGGYWAIVPGSEGWTTKQLYIPDTNVLITRFLSPDGVGELQDFMPVAAQGYRPHCLIRRVVCVRGRMPFHLEVEPRFDYGRSRHETRLHERGARLQSPTLSVALGSPLPLERSEQGVRVRASR